ncbi:MAG: CRISPR-associated endonuclease Cas2 [Candidatus Gracilibacteria bacterium]|nr:CRISPR-associated endonuclease Cas2 [Candidatus Gracilibacteria bacterium]
MRVLRLSSEKMYLAITYDISNNKARSKIVKILTSYGFRVQKSVFEVEITKGQYQTLKKSLTHRLEFSRKKYGDESINIDSVKFYILSKVGEGNLDGRIDGLGDGYEQAYFDDFLIL